MLRTGSEDAEYYASLPRKRIGVCALIFYKNEILIVQPNYHHEWLLPGGIVEAEESPTESLRRVLKVDLNIRIQSFEFQGLDYVPNLGIQGEYIQIIFCCNDLKEIDIPSIKPNPYTLNDFAFVSPDRALERLTPIAANRLRNLLSHDSKRLIYLENGHTLF